MPVRIPYIHLQGKALRGIGWLAVFHARPRRLPFWKWGIDIGVETWKKHGLSRRKKLSEKNFPSQDEATKLQKVPLPSISLNTLRIACIPERSPSIFVKQLPYLQLFRSHDQICRSRLNIHRCLLLKSRNHGRTPLGIRWFQCLISLQNSRLIRMTSEKPHYVSSGMDPKLIAFA